MSPLEQAAAERLEEFRLRLKAYKKQNKMYYQALQTECELTPYALPTFLNGNGGMTPMSIYKIHLATGIPL